MFKVQCISNVWTYCALLDVFTRCFLFYLLFKMYFIHVKKTKNKTKKHKAVP